MPQIDFKVRDETPEFLCFYDSATKNNASEAEQWELWKSMYDFATVPPTRQGDSISRDLLNNGWHKNPQSMPLIRNGA